MEVNNYMTSERSMAIPVRDVEVVAVVYERRRWYGRLGWAGHLRYRLLATRGFAVGSFWLDYQRRDGFEGLHPLCKAKTRTGLIENLRAEAAKLGCVTRFTEERSS